MIFITIQGVEKGGAHESVLNAKKIEGEEKENEIAKLLNFINQNKINANKRFIGRFGDKYFCTLTHPQKDIYGRGRLAMIYWDKDESEENIKQSLKIAGLSYEDFKLQFDEATKKDLKLKSNNNYIKILILFIAILVILFLIFK